MATDGSPGAAGGLDARLDSGPSSGDVFDQAAGSPGELALLAGWVDGTGPVAVFNNPRAVASDGTGNLFVSDTGFDTIRKIVIATGVVTTLAGRTGAWGNVGASIDGTGIAARFYSPGGLACDGAGNLFVADTQNHAIRKVVIAPGVVTTLAGQVGTCGSADGFGSGAQFCYPTGLASDGAGSLFVADQHNGTVRKVELATGLVTTVVGSPGRLGIALCPLPAQLGAPVSVAFVPPGLLFIVDASENAILVARF